ncbi:MAG TPA: hypothetical protein VMQ61_00930 [Thermoanaerobaculia bacterium]|nr:hypothetical protein [Thermoanaerobaculia bacterium]
MGARRARSWRRLAAIAFLLLVAARAAADETSGPTLHFVGSRSRDFEEAVTRAVDAASTRLGEERCGAILLEFHDPSGRVLQDRLWESGLGPREYLGRLLFLDGDRTPFCQSSERLAGSAPGGRFVLLCGRRFGRLSIEDPRYAAVVLLHETLHTLGLPENPPSSAEITERVFAKCGK